MIKRFKNTKNILRAFTVVVPVSYLFYSTYCFSTLNMKYGWMQGLREVDIFTGFSAIMGCAFASLLASFVLMACIVVPIGFIVNWIWSNEDSNH